MTTQADGSARLLGDVEWRRDREAKPAVTALKHVRCYARQGVQFFPQAESNGDETGAEDPGSEDSGPPESPTPSDDKQHRLRVFALDDDPADLTLVLDVLEANMNVYEHAAFHSSEEALAALSDGRPLPDLILIDVNMPRMNGFEFIEAVRREIVGDRQPVMVMLTTSSYDRDVERARAAGIRGYVVKPDTFEELARRVGRVIESTIAELGGKQE